MKIMLNVDCSDLECDSCRLQDEASGNCVCFTARSDADWEVHQHGGRLEECVEATVAPPLISMLCVRCRMPIESAYTMTQVGPAHHRCVGVVAVGVEEVEG